MRRKLLGGLAIAFAALFVLWLRPQTRSFADDGCMGDCGNKKAAAAGWCGNCKDHCPGGTENECSDSCGAEYDEKPCLKQVDHDVDDCYKGCNGDPPCEGNCGGQFKIDRIQHCHNEKAASNDRRRDCLSVCGGQKDCRDAWCADPAPKRKKCYDQVKEADGACSESCGVHPPKCSAEKCLGVARYATCDGKLRVTGFCASFTWPL